MNRETRRIANLVGLALFAVLASCPLTASSAALPAASGSPVVLVPEDASWCYTMESPAVDWLKPQFNDHDWAQGQAGFGDGGTLAPSVRTPWRDGQIWLRRTVKLDSVPANPQLAFEHCGEVQVYINGHLVADVIGNTPRFVPMPIQGEALASLKIGDNVIAIHAARFADAPFISLRLEDAANPGEAPAPLYRDPRFDGAADPMVIWNREQKCWTMFYSQRRANLKHLPGVGYCYGCDIGMAVSKDGGRTWAYDGEAQGLEFDGGRNTFWAPEVFRATGEYHMIVTYIRGVYTNWDGVAIFVHMTSKDLKHWTYADTLPMHDVIDAAIFPMPTGGWRLFYKQDNHTWIADTFDLHTWVVGGQVTTDSNQEGPNVFRWKDHYWLIADVWHGQTVYRSDDLKVWVPQEGDTLLGKPGKRRDDGAFGRHADVVVQGDRAFIVYFTHPGGDKDHELATSFKRTSVQVAELEYKDGKIVCDRDKPQSYKWDPALLDW